MCKESEVVEANDVENITEIFSDFFQSRRKYTPPAISLRRKWEDGISMVRVSFHQVSHAIWVWQAIFLSTHSPSE